MTFYMKSHRKCGDTGNRAMSRRKKELYFVDILHSISEHPIAGVTNYFKGTAGLLKGSSTFASRGEKNALDRAAEK